ncbi:GNAT family N-acetyltransferase [Rhizobium sp. RU36D]|uniref:GNAT family N-acetyltransferase n=1 Tax=Rhizobium sp. RU36D TaxID=1907415 RepID=UPI0009D89023|nr:GNAT family N-acetyltransferase [Rhizobium sp. RU36D]SMC82088.1 Acetyltransferase (GNAT) family protein [Rhizobium sp. RU36D]
MVDISLVDAEDEDFAKGVLDILDASARDLGRPFEPNTVQFRAGDADGHLFGGLVGSEVQGWFFVKYLAVTAEVRGQGVGARLLAAAEQLARDRGLAGVYLDTFDFQAPRFYSREGYVEMGRLPAAGGAPQRIWFVKAF